MSEHAPVTEKHRKLATAHNGHDWHGTGPDGRWYCESCNRLAQLFANALAEERRETLEQAAQYVENIKHDIFHRGNVANEIRALAAREAVKPLEVK